MEEEKSTEQNSICDWAQSRALQFETKRYTTMRLNRITVMCDGGGWLFIYWNGYERQQYDNENMLSFPTKRFNMQLSIM